MRYLLLHPPTWRPDSVAPALETSQVEARPVRQARELSVANDRPTVFLLDADSRSSFPIDVMRAFVDAGGAIVALARNDESDVPDGMPTEFLSGFLTQPMSPRRLTPGPSRPRPWTCCGGCFRPAHSPTWGSSPRARPTSS